MFIRNAYNRLLEIERNDCAKLKKKKKKEKGGIEDRCGDSLKQKLLSIFAQFTRLTQWEGGIGSSFFPRTRAEAQPADDYRYADVTMGQELREAHSAAFWCITFISPRGTLVRDATMRSDTSSLFVVAVQENLTTHLRPYEYGIPFVPKDPSVSRSSPLARFDRSKLRSTTRRSGGIEAIKIGQFFNCWRGISILKCSSFIHRSRFSKFLLEKRNFGGIEELGSDIVNRNM